MTQLEKKRFTEQKLLEVTAKFDREVKAMPAWKKWLFAHLIEFVRELLIDLADQLLQKWLKTDG